MFYRENGIEHSAVLNRGDIFYATIGTEHVAHPKGEARILVVESEGSVYTDALLNGDSAVGPFGTI
jgi:hypothetical protein